MPNVQLHLLEESRSGVIGAIAYDASERWLYVQFKKTGDVWRYEGVEAKVVEGLVAAGSIGREFSRAVKTSFNGERVGPAAWALIVDAGKELTAEQRTAAYQASNKTLFEQLRRSEKAVGF